MLDTRINFFNGQKLTVTDFQTESNYHFEAMKEHNTSMHSWGVCRGLLLGTVLDNNLQFTVSPGTAATQDGQFIEIAATQTLTISTSDAATYATLYAVLSINEEPTDNQTEPPGTIYTSPTRITETVSLVYSTSDPGNPGKNLILGIINMDTANSRIDAATPFNFTTRVTTGAITGDLELRSSTFLVDEAGANDLPKLKSKVYESLSALHLEQAHLYTAENIIVNGDMGIGKEPAAALDITGKYTTDLDGNTTYTPGNANISQDFNITGALNTLQSNFSNNLNVAGTANLFNLNVTGATRFENADPLEPSLVVRSGSTLGSTLDIITGSALNMNSSLEVTGTATQINSTTLQAAASSIQVNEIAPFAGPQATPTGISFNRGAQPDAMLHWNEAAGKWEFGVSGQMEEIAVEKDISELLVGAIAAFSTDNVPPGWLYCDGSEVSRITYEPLFKRVDTIFGVPSNGSVFKLPDLRGQRLQGTKFEIAQDQNIVPSIASHYHEFKGHSQISTTSSHNHTYFAITTDTYWSNHSHYTTFKTGTGHSYELPANPRKEFHLAYYIRY